MNQLLPNINSVTDLRRLSLNELTTLAGEIREKIIEVVSKNGGHLAPNLGTVELTLALHYVFSTPKDKIIWDVGHQSYTHKIITGRKERFATLRKEGGLSGFPKRRESEFDSFDSGHSGEAISVALGMAVARDYKGEKDKIIVVIGDGSLGAGVALEGLNYCGSLKKDIIIILNDNKMSIAKSNSALSHYLSRIITGRIYNRLKRDVWNLLGHLPKDLTQRTRRLARKLEEGLKNLLVPSLIFEELGFRYFGPFDGHNLKILIEIFNRLKGLSGPLLVHITTKKGKGYPPAEKNPELFHGIGPFDLQNPPCNNKKRRVDFSSVLGKTLIDCAQRDKKVFVLTPGMCLGSGLEEFREVFPERFFDCGICEQHAVAFAAGLALAGLKPVVAIYSTFLPRAYDQLLYNICLQNLPVLFAIDRSGIVGEDGETHQGIFDLSYLRFIPNLTIMAPKDESELRSMLFWAIENLSSPIAIRYPKGSSHNGKETEKSDPPEIYFGKGIIEKEGKDLCILTIGYPVKIAERVAEELAREGIVVGVVNARFVKPLDCELLLTIAQRYKTLCILEENVLEGGFGSGVLEFYAQKGIPVRIERFGLPSVFIEHGDRQIILERYGFGVKELVKKIKNIATVGLRNWQNE